VLKKTMKGGEDHGIFPVAGFFLPIENSKLIEKLGRKATGLRL